MATSEGIPSSIDIEFLELNDNPYIKTNSEFYLIRNHIDYLEATNATDEEIIKFDTLITLYEEKIKEKMERQRKKQL